MPGTDSTIARLLPSGEPLSDGGFRRVYDFLNLESDCLGLGEYETWYGLLSPAVTYKVLAPAFLDATRPRRYGLSSGAFSRLCDPLRHRRGGVLQGLCDDIDQRRPVMCNGLGEG